jgi:outer membrane protein assembly factor BamE (lipoprotein component of BamABCDE complex)
MLKRLGVLLLVLAGLALVAGCDQKKISELEEGVATEADVRAKFGEPAAVYSEENGARTFEYPRQPEGQVNYMITIGSDGKMSSLRQVLKDASFVKVTPGMDKVQLRRLLGRPAQTKVFELKQQEVWDWRFRDNTNNENKLFSVTLDKNGAVLTTATTLDPRTSMPGGG